MKSFAPGDAELLAKQYLPQHLHEAWLSYNPALQVALYEQSTSSIDFVVAVERTVTKAWKVDSRWKPTIIES